MDRLHAISDVIEEVLQRLLHHHLDEGVDVAVEHLPRFGGASIVVEMHVQSEREGTAVRGFQANVRGFCAAVEHEPDRRRALHLEGAALPVALPFADAVLGQQLLEVVHVLQEGVQVLCALRDLHVLALDGRHAFFFFSKRSRYPTNGLFGFTAFGSPLLGRGVGGEAPNSQDPSAIRSTTPRPSQ